MIESWIIDGFINEQINWSIWKYQLFYLIVSIYQDEKIIMIILRYKYEFSFWN